MPKFKVVQGKHSEGGRRWVPGTIVDSKSDLSRFNRPGEQDKFVEMPDSVEASPGVPIITRNVVKDGQQQATQVSVPPARYKLDGMSMKDLQQVADAEEVDIKGLTKVQDVIAKLKKDLGYS